MIISLCISDFNFYNTLNDINTHISVNFAKINKFLCLAFVFYDICYMTDLSLILDKLYFTDVILFEILKY